MAGWIAFILGLFIVGIAAAKQMGHVYCLPVTVGWYVLLIQAGKREKKKT
jgi:hypothetical protein